MFIKSALKEQNPCKETCKLCLTEIFIILEQNHNCINKRSELMGSCRHQTNVVLKNWKILKHEETLLIETFINIQIFISFFSNNFYKVL